MKIALVHDWLTGMRGGEKCLEVACHRFPQADLFTLLHKKESTSPAIERMRITQSPLGKLPGIANWYRYALPAMPWAIEKLEIPSDVDLVLSFSHAVAKGVRVPPGVPHICYCFTPMRYAWHLRQDYFGVQRSWNPIARLRAKLLDRVREWDREASERVTHFVAISQTVRERIRSCYGRSARVIHPPVDVDFYTPDESPREDYYLVVSALVPYKRVDLAISACKQLKRKLVIVGAGPEAKRLARQAGPEVKLTGWLSNFEIREHLRRAKALLFPGNEDFGIVPLESQACGMPVIAYARGGATETVVRPGPRGGTGLLFGEQTVESLVEAISKFEATPEQFSAQLARRQAERFSARRFERELLEYVRHVGAQGIAERAAA